MWKSPTTLSLIPVVLLSLTLHGCSSGGGGDSAAAAPVYAGNVSPAAINATSAETMGRTATEGVNEAVNMMSTGDGIPFFPVGVETNSPSDALAQKTRQIAMDILEGSAMLDIPAAAVMSSDQLNAETGGNAFCGGSVIIPDNIDQNAALNFTMTFVNLCYDDGINALTMNGVLAFTETDTAFSIIFTNFSVVIDGNTETFSGTFTCDTTLSNCAIATDFAGSDGNIFRLENVDINGDNVLGYTVIADFYHYELGMVSITTPVSVSYGACGIYPDGGTITLTGTAGSFMSVTFNPDCTFTLQGFDGSGSFGPDTLSWTL